MPSRLTGDEWNTAARYVRELLTILAVQGAESDRYNDAILQLRQGGVDPELLAQAVAATTRLLLSAEMLERRNQAISPIPNIAAATYSA